MHRAKTNRWILAILICVALCLLLWFSGRNKIVGTVYGEEMERIVVNNVTYVPNTVEICNGTDKSVYIGKGARSNGEVVVDLYKLDQDTNLSYLYVRFGQKGQIYQRENLFSK